MAFLTAVTLAIGITCAAAILVTTDERFHLDAARVVADQGVPYFFHHYSELLALGKLPSPHSPPHRVGNDLPVTFFFALSVFLLRLIDEPTPWYAMGAGLAIGLGLLSKYTMGLFFLLLLYVALINRDPLTRRRLATSTLVSLIFLGSWAAYLVLSGTAQQQVEALAFHAGTTTRDAGQSILLFSWGRIRYRLIALILKIPSSIGFYMLPLIGAGGWVFWRRGRPSDQLVVAWLASVGLPFFVLLPVNRCFMPAYPALALLMSAGLYVFPRDRLAIVVLTLFFLLSSSFLYLP